MNTPKIAELSAELARLEAARRQEDAPIYLDAEITLLKRRLRWHLLRHDPKRHRNVGIASLCDAGRPKRPPYDESPVIGASI
jgi:hypothetical protein